jgi:hypothetical protein
MEAVESKTKNDNNNKSLLSVLQKYQPKIKTFNQLFTIELNSLIKILKSELQIFLNNFHVFLDAEIYKKYKTFEDCKLSIINNNFIINQYNIESIINLIYHAIMDEMTPIYHNYGKKILIMCAYLQFFSKNICKIKYREYQNTSNLFFQLLFAHNAESYMCGISVHIIPYIKQRFNTVLLL